MPRRPSHSTFRAFDLSPAGPEPLHRQLYQELRRAILGGRLAAGSRLPASRELASVSRVSRNTVLSAYDQLLAEGYIESRAGSGTFVAEAIPEAIRPDRAAALAPRGPAARATPDLSNRGERVRETPFGAHRMPQSASAFRLGLPALDHFPDGHLAPADRPAAPARLGPDCSRTPTRRDTCRCARRSPTHLAASRGVRCEASNVIVVNGSQHGIALCTRLLTDPGDEVWMEDPGYFAARAALQACGARVVPVPVDRDGLDVAAGDRAITARAHRRTCTPSHQNPTGATMSLPRRMALLQWANDAGSWILEDDNASEYRYRGRPLAALQGIDTHGRVHLPRHLQQGAVLVAAHRLRRAARRSGRDLRAAHAESRPARNSTLTRRCCRIS